MAKNNKVSTDKSGDSDEIWVTKFDEDAAQKSREAIASETGLPGFGERRHKGSAE